jgi:hypothetical protein
VSPTQGGYYCLGAVKILAPIGKAFTEEMEKLQVTGGSDR